MLIYKYWIIKMKDAAGILFFAVYWIKNLAIFGLGDFGRRHFMVSGIGFGQAIFKMCAVQNLGYDME
ncbi:hypothetical protein WQ57_19745 [Mesobacillus campisalis]|uniref:Uncharacterized protein n=1 Tax=Mesobacillus campisalis TaxID=1408103 RepID=A0A0M2SQ09_9BACI|nr:hypothetical protein WQ57_19745 [Mesobacillus campisalis]